MIGAWYHSRSATITSVPSMSGRPRSKMIASGGWLAATASASRPVPAVRTWYLPGAQVDPQRADQLGLVLDDEDAGAPRPRPGRVRPGRWGA